MAADCLSPDLLIAAYHQGLFPMAEGDEIHWHFPDPRGILPLDAFHCPKSLARTVRSGCFAVTWNQDFPGVLAGCADREETWLDARISHAVTELQQRGLAHSLEIWDGHGLVGGLYGVALGGAFFGESMFSRRTDASKVALVHLVHALRQHGFSLLDCQWTTTHLRRFGAIDIPAADYLARLQQALSTRPLPLPPPVPPDAMAWTRADLSSAPR